MSCEMAVLKAMSSTSAVTWVRVRVRVRVRGRG
jgi:hypothetical protein